MATATRFFNTMAARSRRSAVGLLLLLTCAVAPALTAADVDADIRAGLLKLADEDKAVRAEGLDVLVRTGDDRVEDLLYLYRIAALYVYEGKVFICLETTEDDDYNEFVPLSDVLTREPVLDAAERPIAPPLDDVIEISPGRAERKLADGAKSLLRLSSRDAAKRLAGARKCADPPQIVVALARLKEMAEKDPDEKVRYAAAESMYLIQTCGVLPDLPMDERTEAARMLGEMKSLRSLPRMTGFLEELEEAEEKPYGTEALAQAYRDSIAMVTAHQDKVTRIENVFRGFSLGSVLILMALGLAITFGLMGVINMAHGELMMIGAYATYEVQLMFVRLIENETLSQNQYDWYYIVAMPTAFLAAAGVGLLMEALVVRHLYRRPLASLLATWGIGLILIQAVRGHYGDNIGVNAPEWARGSMVIMQDVNLPHARIFIILLCLVSVVLIYCLMNYTKIGLQIRATMQSRDMAKGLGVNTRKVDRFTFAFGAGLAGIAGCAWTLIGGVTPDMGQTNFIVDSFLVVVVGGVGELIGVVCAGLGIGILTKVIEPGTGAIWAKIILLIGIVIFIQFKPSGLFAPKGRLADD